MELKLIRTETFLNYSGIIISRFTGKVKVSWFGITRAEMDCDLSNGQKARGNMFKETPRLCSVKGAKASIRAYDELL